MGTGNLDGRVGDTGGMANQVEDWGIRMKWWIWIGVGVVNMDEAGVVHIDWDEAKDGGGRYDIFLEKGY